MELAWYFAVSFFETVPCFETKTSCVTQPIPKPYQPHIDVFFLMAISACGFSDALGLPYPTRITRRHHEESMGISLDVPTRLVASRVLAQLGGRSLTQ